MRESEHGVYPGLLLFGVHSVSGVGFSDPIGHTEETVKWMVVVAWEKLALLIVDRIRSSPPFRDRSIGR